MLEPDRERRQVLAAGFGDPRQRGGQRRGSLRGRHRPGSRRFPRRHAAAVRAVLPRRPCPAGRQRPGTGGGSRPGRGPRRPDLGENRPEGGARSASRSPTARSRREQQTRGARILVVDDEPALRQAVERNLAGHGFEVRGAETGEGGLSSRPASTRTSSCSTWCCLTFRHGGDPAPQERSSLPIIVLSVREAEGDKVRALELGADDYLTKPFGVDELLARIRVALRHARARASTRTRSSAVASCRSTSSRRCGRRRVHLTPTEYALLGALIADAGRVLTDRASCSGCGARVRLGGPLPARVHGPAAQEAGARSGQSALPAHRAGRRLPPARTGDRSARWLSSRVAGLRQC